MHNAHPAYPEVQLPQEASCSAVAILQDARSRVSSASIEPREVKSLPAAVANLHEIRQHMSGKRLLIFLDYDGTLTPIVSDPELAFLSPSMRATISQLSQHKKVAIVSGRSREKVQNFVQLSSLVYAGSHGFDIAGPGGLRHKIAEAALPTIAATGNALRERLKGIPGVQIEDNQFSMSVHWRNTPQEFRSVVYNVTIDEVQRRDGIQYTAGKCVYEVRPKLPGTAVWNKGEAMRFLLDYLSEASLASGETPHEGSVDGVLPIFIGDDTTDEDAFAVLHELGGLGFLVASPAETERPRQTYATHVLADCAEVETLLSAFISM